MPLPRFAIASSADAGDPLSASAVRVTAVRPGTEGEAITVLGVRRRDRALLRERLNVAGATGRTGELTPVQLATADGPEWLALGIGAGSPADLRRAGAALARRSGADDRLLIDLGAIATASLAAFVDGYGLACYVPPRSGKPAPAPEVTLAVAAPDAAAEPVLRAARIVAAVHLARDLAQTPANTKSPQWLADQAVAVAAASGLQARVWTEPALRAEGFGGLIGVGQGSARPPRFVELSYRPGRPASEHVEHVALVGKGITFDSGGISIKPAAGMESMKTDMSGAAAVIGAMSALSDVGVAVRVTALLAVAENLPGAGALRPGDVITPFGSELTVEVLNTDAEGRLVLADALGYADQVLKPDVIVDLATLTGAATMALGRRDAPLYATDERLAASLERAAHASGERVWRMPLVDDYRSALDSTTADIANAATGGVGGGSITAALFLREFTGGRAWAHLDIAGTARSDRDVDELCKGGTGYGVRLLLHWLTRR